MKQYNAIKQRYPGALLLFRVGDFYETFGEDAVKASKILDITLTKRGAGSSSEVALAGFPHHSLDSYLPKLVRAGQRVAICDQLEDPKTVKGIVKRGVTELVTPGVSFNDNVLDVKRNNYLASVHISKDFSGVSFLDISTGEFVTSQGDLQYIDKLLQSFNPAEVLFCKNKRDDFNRHFGDKFNTYAVDEWVFNHDYAYETLCTHFGTTSLKGFGIDILPDAIISAGAIFFYLNETEHKDVKHIVNISRIEEEKYVWLDKFTIRNLELIYPQHPEGIPLITILDKTLTPMGSRMLKKWMVLPLKEISPIQERLNVVESLVNDQELQASIQNNLKNIGDLERLISKVAVRRVNPREMQQLRKALEQVKPLKETLRNSENISLKKISDQLSPCEFLVEKINNELKLDPPYLTNQGNLIKEGIHAELDE
ncbi:MAG TPA: hypothetical protein VNW99_09180, partial [Cytophagaceae bacterium]|nr:hypothetical protein [Cytophagaceae bacterium]